MHSTCGKNNLRRKRTSHAGGKGNLLLSMGEIERNVFTRMDKICSQMENIDFPGLLWKKNWKNKWEVRFITNKEIFHFEGVNGNKMHRIYQKLFCRGINTADKI